MIDRISNFDDLDYIIYVYSVISSQIIMQLIAFLGMLLLIIKVLISSKKIKENLQKTLGFFGDGLLVIMGACFVLSTILIFFTGLNKQVNADQLMKLAEAESTLLQLKAVSVITKEPPVIDPKVAQNWMDKMRADVAAGLDYSEYATLVNEFNSFRLSEPKMKNWFSENSNEAVYDEIKANMMRISQNNQVNSPIGQLDKATDQQVPTQHSIDAVSGQGMESLVDAVLN